MMAALEGTHALVTGGGSGIGAAIACKLAEAGASLSLVGRKPGPLETLARALPRATAITADVTRASDVRAMVETAHGAFGPIDILIACAGAAQSAPFARVDLAHWRRMLDVNLTGAFLTAHAAMGDIRRAAPSSHAPRRIIFIASTAGLKGYPYVAPYVAAKHGVIGLMRALAAEFARTNVTVNAVCPGFTETPLLESSLDTIVAETGRARESAKADLVRSNPQGRFITPGEIADTVLWLCSTGARSVSGQAISVSGGET
jgi:NAD(P)-dependent dehydrogenase (short-subunit alcohol dehydrogenase family)